MINKILVLLFSLCLFSCKKTYTCDCKSTWVFKSTSSGNYYTYIYPGDKTAYSEKLSKKQAIAACEHQENTIESDLISGITESGKYPLKGGESVETECNLIID